MVNPNQYHSLMSLISSELNISYFGLCNGMGSCGTCNVLINGQPVMACEVSINFSLDGAKVEIDESAF